eukprot:SAG31_NODE_27190_length_430_cov_0.661631_1_plen_25_part_01
MSTDAANFEYFGEKEVSLLYTLLTS